MTTTLHLPSETDYAHRVPPPPTFATPEEAQDWLDQHTEA